MSNKIAVKVPDWYNDEIGFINIQSDEEPNEKLDLDEGDYEIPSIDAFIDDEDDEVIVSLNIEESDINFDENIELVAVDREIIESDIEKSNSEDEEITELKSDEIIAGINVNKAKDLLESRRLFMGEDIDGSADISLVEKIAKDLAIDNSVAENIIKGLQNEVIENSKKLGIDTSIVGKQKATKLTLDLFEKLNESKAMSKTYATQLIEAENRLLNPDNEEELLNLVNLICKLTENNTNYDNNIPEEEYIIEDNLQEDLVVDDPDISFEEDLESPSAVNGEIEITSIEDDELEITVIEDDELEITVIDDEELELTPIEDEGSVGVIEEDISLIDLVEVESHKDMVLEEDIKLVGLSDTYDEAVSEDRITSKDLEALYQTDDDESSTYSLKDLEINKDKIKETTVF